MKRGLIVLSFILLMSGCGSKNDDVETSSNLTPSITAEEQVQENQNMDVSSVEAEQEDVIETIDQTVEPAAFTAVEQEDTMQENSVRFTAKVISINPKLVVETSELNPPETEQLTLQVNMITTYGERAASRYEINNTYPVDELQIGDIIQVDTDYDMIDHRKVVNGKYYPGIDLIKSSKNFDFSNERTIEDAMEQAQKGITDISTVHYSCHPKCFAKAYEGDMKGKEELENLKDLLSDYTVFCTPVSTVEPIKSVESDFELFITDKADHKVKLAFTEENLYIYVCKNSLGYQLVNKCDYYRSSIPSWNEVLHLFLTKSDMDKIAKSYIKYQESTDEVHPYFKGEGITSYPMNQGYLIDLNQDGTKEKVFIGCAGSPLSYTEYDRSYYMTDPQDAVIKMYVNGKSVYVIDEVLTDVTAFAVIDLNPKDSMQEIVLYNIGPSADYSYTFYHYKKNRIKEIGSAQTYEMELDKQPDGTSNINGMLQLSNLQTWSSPATWKLTKDDKIKEVVPKLYYPTYEATLKYKIRCYQDMSLSSKEVMVDQQNVTFTATDNKDWIQMQLGDGSKVWLHLKDHMMINSEDILEMYDDDRKTVYPGEIFDGLCYCG